ncbi:hypothetical protein QPM05_13105, partial [Caldibacillus thermoamylovorans]|nr:hypothetical protein [Caldibacillus thermoamylovorans]
MFLYPSFFHAFFKNKNPYTNLIMKRHLNKSAKEFTAGFFIALIFHFDYKEITQRVVMSMCKILLEGQMSGKKWEDALSFKCT